MTQLASLALWVSVAFGQPAAAEGPRCPGGTVEIARDETTRDLHCARIAGLGLAEIRRLSPDAIGALGQEDRHSLRLRQASIEVELRSSLATARQNLLNRLPQQPQGPARRSPAIPMTLATLLAAGAISWLLWRRLLGDRLLAEAKRELELAAFAIIVAAALFDAWMLLGAGRVLASSSLNQTVSSAETAPLAESEAANLWGNPAALQRHFADHGADFGAKSPQEYARSAANFLMRSQEAKLPTKIDPEGVIRVYDARRNIFGSYNPDGTVKTFFKPDPKMHGRSTNWDYWLEQRGVSQ